MTLAQYERHAARYGTEGIVEAAESDLEDKEVEILREQIQKLRKPQNKTTRRSK